MDAIRKVRGFIEENPAISAAAATASSSAAAVAALPLVGPTAAVGVGAYMSSKAYEAFSKYIQRPVLGTLIKNPSMLSTVLSLQGSQPEMQKRFDELRGQGMGTLAANRAVYEEWKSPPLVKGSMELFIDPINLFPFGIVAKGEVVAAKVAGKPIGRSFSALMKSVGYDPFRTVLKLRPGTAIIEEEVKIANILGAFSPFFKETAERLRGEAVAIMQEKVAKVDRFGPYPPTRILPSRLEQLQAKYQHMPIVTDEGAMANVASLREMKEVLRRDLGLPPIIRNRRLVQAVESISNIPVEAYNAAMLTPSDVKAARMIEYASNINELMSAHNTVLLMRSGDAMVDEAARRMGSKINHLIKSTLGQGNLIMNSAIRLGPKGLEALSSWSAITESAKAYTARLGFYIGDKEKAILLNPAPATQEAANFVAFVKAAPEGSALFVPKEQYDIYNLFAAQSTPKHFNWPAGGLLAKSLLREVDSLFTAQTKQLQALGVPVELIDREYLPWLFKDVKTNASDTAGSMLEDTYTKFLKDVSGVSNLELTRAKGAALENNYITLLKIIKARAPFQKKRELWTFMEAVVNGGMRLREEITTLSDVVQLRSAAAARALAKHRVGELIQSSTNEDKESVLKVLFGESAIPQGVTGFNFVSKLFKLGVDLSPFGIQGPIHLAYLVEHPTQVVQEWATSVINIALPSHYKKWVLLNADRMAAFARDGGVVGNILEPPEIRGSLKFIFQPLENISNIPFQRGLMPLKVQAYEWSKELLSRDSLYAKIFGAGKGLSAYRAGREAAESTNVAFGGLNRIKNGETLSRRDTENLFFLIPGFTKATISLAARAFELSPQGALARHYLIGMTATIAAPLTALQYATTGTFPNLTDTSRSDWFMFRVKVGDRYYTLGAPGFNRFRQLVMTIMNPTEKWLRFIRSKASLPLGELWTQASGRTYLNEPTSRSESPFQLVERATGAAARTFGPIGVSNIFSDIAQSSFSPLTAISQVFGGNLFVETAQKDDILNAMAALAKSEFGMDAAVVDAARGKGISMTAVRDSEDRLLLTDAERVRLYRRTAVVLGIEESQVRSLGRPYELSSKEKGEQRDSDIRRMVGVAKSNYDDQVKRENIVIEGYREGVIDAVGVRKDLQESGKLSAAGQAQLRKAFATTLDYLDKHPRENPNAKQQAYDEIASSLFGPDTTDDLGQIVYPVYESHLREVNKKYGESVVKEFFSQWRANKEGIVRQYYEEVPGNPLLKEYWKVPEEILRASWVEDYRRYHMLFSPTAKSDFESTFAAENGGLSYNLYVESAVDKARIEMRGDDAELNALLVKWYGRAELKSTWRLIK